MGAFIDLNSFAPHLDSQSEGLSRPVLSDCKRILNPTDEIGELRLASADRAHDAEWGEFDISGQRRKEGHCFGSDLQSAFRVNLDKLNDLIRSVHLFIMKDQEFRVGRLRACACALALFSTARFSFSL